MEFTTHFELQSQTTRLVDCRLILTGGRESHPLSCPFPRNLARLVAPASKDYNSAPGADWHLELFPLQSPLLGESLLVSFPPLNYMLKFGGSSCLIWDLEIVLSSRLVETDFFPGIKIWFTTITKSAYVFQSFLLPTNAHSELWQLTKLVCSYKETHGAGRIDTLCVRGSHPKFCPMLQKFRQSLV